jgi:hypothetical protein
MNVSKSFWLWTRSFLEGRSQQDEVIPYGSTSNMQEVLDAMNDWALINKMKLNAKKMKDTWICFKDAIPEPPSLMIGNDTIQRVNSFKLLGLWINNILKWNTHTEETTKKANKRLFYLRECRRANLPTKVGLTCYETKSETGSGIRGPDMGWFTTIFYIRAGEYPDKKSENSWFTF